MKIIKTGWVAKSDFGKGKVPWIIDTGTYWYRLAIYKTKGKREEWVKEDWPPVKVKVTIEEA